MSTCIVILAFQTDENEKRNAELWNWNQLELYQDLNIFQKRMQFTIRIVVIRPFEHIETIMNKQSVLFG